MRTLPAAEEMHAALAARDAAYEGIFVFGVRTTGVFCRPACPSRRARASHVEFFATPAEAERAGYRACLRCRPDEGAGAPPAWMERLLAEVERRGSERLSDAHVRALGLEPATVRRGFLRHFGLTFQAWQRARALGRAQSSLAAGVPASQAAFDAGYGSESGFRDAFERFFRAPPGAARGLEPLKGTRLGSPLGPLVAIASPQGICLLEFVDRNSFAAQAASLARWHRRPTVPGASPNLAQLERELGEYFSGKRARFDVPLDLAGPPFHMAVWRRLLELAPGSTTSYSELARSLGRPNAARAVAQANARNRLAILVPCHRVVGADGKLTGYAGGLWRKRALLDLERKRAPLAAPPA